MVKWLEEALIGSDKNTPESHNESDDSSDDDGIVVEVIIPKASSRSSSAVREDDAGTHSDLSLSSIEDADLAGMDSFRDEISDFSEFSLPVLQRETSLHNVGKETNDV